MSKKKIVLFVGLALIVSTVICVGSQGDLDAPTDNVSSPKPLETPPTATAVPELVATTPPPPTTIPATAVPPTATASPDPTRVYLEAFIDFADDLSDIALDISTTMLWVSGQTPTVKTNDDLVLICRIAEEMIEGHIDDLDSIGGGEWFGTDIGDVFFLTAEALYEYRLGFRACQNLDDSAWTAHIERATELALQAIEILDDIDL